MFSSGIQNQILVSLDSFASLDKSEKSEKWQWPVRDQVGDSDDFFNELCFSDNGLKNQQLTVQIFWNIIKF